MAPLYTSMKIVKAQKIQENALLWKREGPYKAIFSDFSLTKDNWGLSI